VVNPGTAFMTNKRNSQSLVIGLMLPRITVEVPFCQRSAGLKTRFLWFLSLWIASYRWQPIVVSSPGDSIGYQRRVDEIAHRLRFQFDLDE
jgi:hypothetical protein